MRLSLRRRHARGFTLMEVMVALALSIGLLLALMIADASREQLRTETRARSQALIAQTRPALFITHIEQHLGKADRIKIVNTGIPTITPYTAPPNQGKIEFRYSTCTSPTSACLDDSTKYQWDGYRLSGTQLQYLTSLCPGTATVIAEGVTALTFNFYQSEPPPAQADNNVIEYALKWDDGTRSRIFHGKVIGRDITKCGHELPAGDSGDDVGLSMLAPAPPVCL